MDSDESVFSIDDESDGFVPEPKKMPSKKAAAGRPAAKKLTQTTLKAKPAAKKRPIIESENDESASEASGLSNTPPSAKKQKKGNPLKKAGGVPLAEVENDSMALDDESFEKASKKKSDGAHDADEKERFEKLDLYGHIYKRPDTYIGTTQHIDQHMWIYNKTTKHMEFKNINYVPAFFKTFDELMVNAADNKTREKCEKTGELKWPMTFIKVNIDRAAGHITVENNGRPVDVMMSKKWDMWTPELVFGNLLTGDNFSDTKTRLRGGRNGYGAKLTNVFAHEFDLEIQDQGRGKRYRQIWTDNMLTVGAPKITSSKTSSFVKVSYKPDLGYFKMSEGITDDVEGLLYRRVYDIAGTVQGVKVYLNGEHIKLKDFKAYCNLFSQSIANDRSRELGEAVPAYTVEVEGEKEHEHWEVGFTISAGTFQHVSFVNCVSTSAGAHINYIVDQITSHLLTDLNKKKKGHVLKAAQLKPHIFVFIRGGIFDPNFSSQSKDVMNTLRKDWGTTCVLGTAFLKKIAASEAMKSIVESLNEKKTDKLLAKSDGNKRSRVSNAKLVEANLAGTRRGHECTLILTEGDSAKGLAVSGRAILDPDRIGVFPLRGKLLNVRDASLDQITKNQEIQNIKQFLGLKHKQVYTDAKDLRYGHLMIMADQDHDGSHIKGLLINFLQVQFPSLLRIPDFFREFITPIVKVWQGSNPKKPTKLLSFFTQPQYEEWKASHRDEQSRWKSKYFKGLGTSTNEDAQVYFTNLDDHLKEFNIMQAEEAELFELAFSKKKADARKEWLGNFVPGTFLDHSTKTITYGDFVNKELILFSMADNMRSIPSVLDGFKPGQRKVIYACFKRNLVNDKKVVELAGYVSEQTAYHHGEQSLQQTIIGLAQDFVGSNNVNCLEPSGNFGSRLAGGSDAASPRYTFTRLSPFARKVFSPMDEPNLDYQYDDGNRIEPTVYSPVIPMVLVNGADGIGTGWSTNIPNYHPVDIIKNLKRRMGRLDPEDPEEKAFETMIPWFRGWKGTPEAAGSDRYKFDGVAKVDEQNPNEVLISELPIRVWTDDFKARLEKIISGVDGPSWIKDYKEFNDHKTVHFEIAVDEKFMGKVMADGILERFKLQKQVATSNLVAFDSNGQIRKYTKVEEILEEYYIHRMKMYTLRKKHWLGVHHADYRRLLNQARFIKEIIENELIVGKKKKDVLVKELRGRNYEAFPRGPDAKKKSTEDDINESEDEEESGSGGARDYDYLLSMPIWSLTAERLAKLEEAIAKKKAEHDELLALSEKDLWCRDLDAFEEAWNDRVMVDNEIQSKIRRMGRRASKKIGAGRGRKPKGDDDYAPEKKAKAKAKVMPVKVETKSSQRFAEMFSAKPKSKKELEVKPKEEDDFSDDDFAALTKSKPAPKARSASQSAPKPEEPDSDDEPVRPTSKRGAASKARTFFGLDDSDDDDEMLGDVGALVKGIGKPAADDANRRLSLHAMSRPESSNGLPKLKTKPSKAVDEDSLDDTNYEMLAKSSPQKATAKGDDINEFLSDDEPAPAPVSKKASAAVDGLSLVKKPRGRLTGTKNKAKEEATAKPKPATKAKVAVKAAPKAASKATSKQTTLSPAAKAYAAKKAVKRSMIDDDSDEDIAEPESPAPKPTKPAARGRPGRAAAARKPIVIDDDEEEEDESDDPFEMDDFDD